MPTNQQKKKLFLHIGYPKTGSSALQAFLALNCDLLARHGIYYPKHPSFNLAQKGHISSGNLPVIDTNWQEIISKAGERIPDECDSILFSSEILFGIIAVSDDCLNDLHEQFDLNLLLFIRNPIEHLFSIYGQSVKRGGSTLSIEEWHPNYRIIKALQILIKKQAQQNFKLKIINYSRIDSITHSFTTMILGNNAAEFIKKAQQPPVKTVNRSLTRAEYEIQRQFNKYYGKTSSAFISDCLVNFAPEIKAENEYLSEANIEKFLNEIREDIDYINQHLEPSNQLQTNFDFEIEPESDIIQLNKKQIDILAKSISDKILTIERQNEIRLEHIKKLEAENKKIKHEKEKLALQIKNKKVNQFITNDRQKLEQTHRRHLPIRILGNIIRFVKNPVKYYRLQRDTLLVRQSCLFDNAWYLNQYPDLYLTTVDLLQHYMLHGWKEGRWPNPNFDVQYYMKQNPDVREKGFNPLVHFILHGWKEGRRPNAWFNQSPC